MKLFPVLHRSGVTCPLGGIVRSTALCGGYRPYSGTLGKALERSMMEAGNSGNP